MPACQSHQNPQLLYQISALGDLDPEIIAVSGTPARITGQLDLDDVGVIGDHFLLDRIQARVASPLQAGLDPGSVFHAEGSCVRTEFSLVTGLPRDPQRWLAREAQISHTASPPTGRFMRRSEDQRVMGRKAVFR
jgi:hypothetical protein